MLLFLGHFYAIVNQSRFCLRFLKSDGSLQLCIFSPVNMNQNVLVISDEVSWQFTYSQSCRHEPGYTWTAARKHGVGRAIPLSKVSSDRFTLALRWLMRTHPTSPSARYACFCLCHFTPWWSFMLSYFVCCSSASCLFLIGTLLVIKSSCLINSWFIGVIIEIVNIREAFCYRPFNI
jgi:hypothetical protein